MADETNDTQKNSESTEANQEPVKSPEAEAPESEAAGSTPEGTASGTVESASPTTPDAASPEAQTESAQTEPSQADTGAPGASSEQESGETAAPSKPQRAHKPRSTARGARPAATAAPAPAPEGGDVEESVVKIYRCAAVVKGGRRFSFAALVVAGDRNGRVGLGYGKANEVPNAVEKATKAARRDMRRIRLDGTTIPHPVRGRFGASKVEMVPAVEGTGVIAGASVRAVLELAGVKDVLTKCHGSTSPKNLVKAAFDGLKRLRSKEDIEKLREVSLA